MFRKKRSLRHDVDDWARLWDQIHPRLAAFAADSGDARLKAELVQFAADLDHIVGIARTLPLTGNVSLISSPTKADPIPSQRSSLSNARSRQRPAVVLVEDEPDILIILHRSLRDLIGGTSHEVVTCISGADALAQVALRHVPLVITDYKMPGLNGLQLTTAIKETSPDTKVALTTAYATPELERKAREQQVDYYLPKPYQLVQLEAIIREVLA
jgi:CheY-like chemotaxis protein